jgi:hypothetical protein
MFWRTPISGNYSHAGEYYTNSSEIDTYCQSVKTKYFTHRSTNTTSETSIIDDGLPIAFVRSGTSTTIVRSGMTGYMFYEYERGQISLSGGTSGTPAKWIDIYNASIAGGWNSFVPITSIEPTGYYSSFDCHDNLVMDGYITDKLFNLVLRGSKYSYPETCFETYGENYSFVDRLGITRHIYRNGGVFTVFNALTPQYFVYFANCKAYDCRFEQAPANGISTARTYISFPCFVGNNNNLYKCVMDGGMAVALENVFFSGTGLILDDVTINGNRYGLNMDAASVPTAVVSNVTITGDVGINANDFPEGDITLTGFTFKNMNSRLNSTYLNSTTKDKVVNEYFVNPTLEVTANGYFDKCIVGINYTLYEQYTLDLNVVEEGVGGVAISGASVKINYGATELFDKTTDVNGEVTTSTITYKKYNAGTVSSATYYNYISDVVTSYASHTVTISKEGYETVILPLVMSKKQSFKVVLKPAVKFMYDENNNIYEKKNKENLTTLKRNRIYKFGK